MWNGSFFVDAWLRQVGVSITLGHGGLPCPVVQKLLSQNPDYHGGDEFHVEDFPVLEEAEDSEWEYEDYERPIENPAPQRNSLRPPHPSEHPLPGTPSQIRRDGSQVCRKMSILLHFKVMTLFCFQV